MFQLRISRLSEEFKLFICNLDRNVIDDLNLVLKQIVEIVNQIKMKNNKIVVNLHVVMIDLKFVWIDLV